MGALMVPIDIGLSTGLVYAWAVLALAIAFRLLDFPDLTIEGSVPLGACVFAILLSGETPKLLAVLGGISAGAAVGAMTAFLHLRFRLNKFLAGILVIAICYSLSLRVMGVSNIGLLQIRTIFDQLSAFDRTRSDLFHPATLTFLLMLIVLGGILLALLLGSRWGMRLRVAGTNPEYATSLGLHVSRYLIAGLALTNALAALCGILLALTQGYADVGMGQGLLILTLAALSIGERLLPNRALSFHLWVLGAAVVGSVIFQTLAAYALRAGLAGTDVRLATAVIVLLVVAFRWSKDGGLLDGVR